MSDNIQVNTAGQTPPCLQHQIEKTRQLFIAYRCFHFPEFLAASVTILLSVSKGIREMRLEIADLQNFLSVLLIRETCDVIL